MWLCDSKKLVSFIYHPVPGHGIDAGHMFQYLLSGKYVLDGKKTIKSQQRIIGSQL
jgi:hypothetical protein